MNRFSLILILALLVSLSGVSIYWTIKFRKIQQQQVDVIMSDIRAMQDSIDNTLNADSVASIAERILIARQDSIIGVYERRLVELQKQIREKKIHKKYMVAVSGLWKDKQKTVNLNLIKTSNSEGQKVTVVDSKVGHINSKESKSVFLIANAAPLTQPRDL